MTDQPTQDTTSEDEELVDLTLTCATEGCGNAGVPITLQVPPSVTSGMCGACGQPITDLEDSTAPEPEPEPKG